MFFFARERIFIETLSVEMRLVVGPQNTLLTGVCPVFSPGTVQAGTVKGLKQAV